MALRINTARPAGGAMAPHPGMASRRLLAVIDYSVQPYNLGDLLIYMTGSLVAAEEAGAGLIDLALISDPSRPPTDPIMGDLVARDGGLTHLLAALPVVQVNPRLGAVHLFDSRADFGHFLAQNGDRYHLWPSREVLAQERYLFYDVFQAVHAHQTRHGAIPQVRFSTSQRAWVHAFFQRHAAGRVPVSVNLRHNGDFHSHRNSVLPAWQAFFGRVATLPVTFFVACAASEMDAGLRACPNLVYAKDHHTNVIQDLALIRHAAFHLGAASGPAAMPIFGTSPYHIVHCDMLPYLELYGGSLLQSGPSELRYAFAQGPQTFGTEPETEGSLLAEFERMWGWRDWVATREDRLAALLRPES